MSRLNFDPAQSRAPADPRSRPDTMRALCRFVAGVAHEYNNYLNVINSNASELMADESLPRDRRANAQRMAVAGERAADLTRQLMLFSGQQPFVPQPVELNAVLADSRPQIERLLGPTHEAQMTGVETPRWLNGDRDMLALVVSSLVANAAEASRVARSVRLTTSGVVLSDSDLDRHPSRRTGRFVCLACQDSGEGIAASARSHVFEPFFTTRAAKAHIGLGLAVVQGIVTSHDGWIELDSQPDQGTEVRIYFPAIDPPVEPVRPPPPVRSTGQPSETILLVEDDDLLRETTVAVLNHAGYRVLQADSSESARETWQWHADRIRLLLTDIVLPGTTSGLDLAAEFRSESPQLRVICTSGFSHEIMRKLGDLPPGFRYLPKPCLPPKMLQAVREILDTPAI